MLQERVPEEDSGAPMESTVPARRTDWQRSSAASCRGSWRRAQRDALGDGRAPARQEEHTDRVDDLVAVLPAAAAVLLHFRWSGTAVEGCWFTDKQTNVPDQVVASQVLDKLSTWVHVFSLVAVQGAVCQAGRSQQGQPELALPRAAGPAMSSTKLVQQ